MCRNLKPGDILFCERNTWLSRVIKRLTKSDYSHVALYIEVWGVPFVIDAQKDGVQFRLYESWHNKYNYNVTALRSNKIASPKQLALRAATKVGFTAYDFTSLIIKHPLLMLTGKWRKKRHAADMMTCSEFVSWVYGIYRSYRMSPKDLHQWCLRNGFHKVDKGV